MSNWVKDGKQVAGKYYGEGFEGVVVNSRVKYGGKVQYTVELHNPINLRWRTEPVSRILVEEHGLVVL